MDISDIEELFSSEIIESLIIYGSESEEFKKKLQELKANFKNYVSQPDINTNDEDQRAYDEFLDEGIDIFGSDYLPPDVARMIAAELIPDTLLSLEIGLLKTDVGQDYMLRKMYKEAKAQRAISDAGCGGVFWKG